MIIPIWRRFFIVLGTIATLSCPIAFAQLDESCVVAVLNRTVQVNHDGTWLLPNIPANFGTVRARATCVKNGVTSFGQSAPFSIASNSSVNVPPIILGPTTPIPTSLSLTPAGSILTQPGATTQLTAIATYSSGPNLNVTAASTGTQYNVSNSAIATVTASGLVTAVSSGTVVIQAVNEGAQGIISVQVALTGASHGGIPDSWALANGLDPTDPALPAEDPDHDGLTNLQEFQNGTDPRNPDTDADGLTDGQEVMIYHSNPLVTDTDGDGVPDGVEVQNGTNPASPQSFDLTKAISSLEVQPATFVLNVNSIQGQASQQLTVLGHLIDGKTSLDLTSTQRGTTYSSSDLNICNFGAPDGNVFAGNTGSCIITVKNSGFTATASATITGFTPKSLSFISIAGFANGVAVNGNYAYVAAGSAGLQVIDVTDRTSPRLVAALSVPGNANDVRAVGNLLYIAAGSAGLHVVDVTNPLAPVRRGTLVTGGNALHVAVRGTTAYVANGSNLLLANVTNPSSINEISAIALTGLIQGVDVDDQRKLVVVAAGANGIYAIDVSNPSAPVLRGSVTTGDARAVAIGGNSAFVADYVNSTVAVDLTTPSSPVVLSRIIDSNLGGFLQDIALSGNFALGADVKFVNGIPITDITNPSQLLARTILNFTQRDDNGMGIAADGSYVYLATEHNNLNKYGTSGDSRLYIGQYLALQDLKGVPPTVSIASPAAPVTVVQGSTLPITVNARDDVAVASVTFLINGQAVFTATSSPYQYSLTVPTGVSSLTLGARAVDLGGNIGNAQTVTLQVIPDPLTQVTGRVVQGPPGVIVSPANPLGWSLWQQNAGKAAINGQNPHLGNGSLEFVEASANDNSALILTNTAAQGFGLVSSLNVLSYDWFIAADSATKVSPDFALRVYPFGDPRSFFLHYTPCTSNCPVGTWQTTNVFGNLIIQQAENNPPPSSIPPGAYVSEIHLRANAPYQGTPYHAFDDNLVIGFTGQQPVTFNFEASATAAQPVAGATVTAFSKTATTGSDGTFTISGVPTVSGNIQVMANATVNKVLLTGLSGSFPPVSGGVTSVGDIAVSSITTDLVRDFLTGPFTYGYTAYPALVPLTPYTLTDTTSHPGAVAVLRSGTFTSSPPYVAKNITGAPLNIGLPFVMPADKLDLHPGPSGEYTVVRYTAPAAGTYSVVGQFVGLDSATTNVFVVLNNTFIFTGTINGAGSTAPFNFTMPLIAGDVLDFAVGWGVNHNYTSDSTGLQGTITTVPTVLALSQSRPIFLFPRQTFSLSASKLDANGQPVPANVTWSTSNPGIATVSGSGLVTANSTGAVRITATDTASQQTATVLVHVSGDFFFWSTSASEIANFASPFWHSDGNVFGIYPNNANLPAQIPLYRFYDPGSGTHFWTTDVNGELFTQQPGVIFEGNIAFVFSSQQPGTVPVYRWFSGATNTHFWTTDPNGEGIPRPEYQSEGAVFYAYPAGSGPAQMLRVHCASCVL